MADTRRPHQPLGARRARASARLGEAARRLGSWARLGSLRSQILLWTILPIAIFLLGLSFTDVYGHQRAMRLMVEERDKALATVVAQSIADNLARSALLLQSVGEDEAFRQAGPLERAQMLDPLAEVFQGGILVLGGQGQPQAHTNAAATWANSPFVATLAQAATTSGRPAYLGTAQEGLPPFHVAIAVPVPGGEGVLIGVLPLSRSVIAGVVDGLQVTPEAQALLFDGQGRLIYRGGVLPAGAGAAQPLPPADVEGVVTTLVPVPGTDWQVVLWEPWHHLLPLVLRYAQATVLVAAAAVLISLLAVYFGVRYVTRPLQELDQQARRMAWGDFETVESPVGGVEEISNLQRTLRQMAGQVRGYQATMRNYVAAVTQAQEEERRRLARELHDDTVQSLIALGQQLERLQKGLPRMPDAARGQVEALRHSTRSLVQDLRRLIGDLRPVYLDDLGLGPALEMLVKTVPPPCRTEVSIRGEVRRLAPDVELALYRIVQAALKNVEQHARATLVRVGLDFEEQGVRAVVEDDGIGFAVPGSPDDLARQGHFGLIGMRERAMLFGGSLSLISQPAKGTRVEAYLPLHTASG